MTKKVKNTVPFTYVLMILKEKKLLTFYENEFAKANQKEFRIEKMIKTKGDELYVKWRG